MKDKLNSFIHLNENDILSKFNSKDLRHFFLTRRLFNKL